MIIMSSDVVSSFYPNLAIRNGLGTSTFTKRRIFSTSMSGSLKKERRFRSQILRNYVYKIILNSTYGLSNDENSFLYDPQFTMSITINGQLSL
jgi:hypothetical protein